MAKERQLKLREKNAASIKVTVLKTTLDLIGKNSFDQLYVTDICDQAGISKVTFFKYFPQKEDILLYYSRAWVFNLNLEFSSNPKNGFDGIRHIFEKVCETYAHNPGMILGLVGYYSKLELPIRPFPFSKYERELLYPNKDIGEIDFLSLDQLFENFILEAIFNKEIVKSSDVNQLVLLMYTILYGTVMTAHIKGVEYPNILFKTTVNSMLDSLGVGEQTFVTY